MTLASPLKALHKPKSLKKLRGLGGSYKLPPIPDLSVEPERIAAVTDDAVQNLTNPLGDEQLAKRVLKMKKNEYPNATMPELVAIDFLKRRGTKWGFQVWALGGRKTIGGQVLDLIVDMGMGIAIWEIQGNYWHNRPGKMQLDKAQKFALVGIEIWGKPVTKVLEIWESRIMTDNRSRRRQVFEMAMSGIELGP